MAYMQRAVLLAKTETVYGTDAVPTGAANAILLTDVDITPLDGDTVERTFIRPFFGQNASLLGGERVRIRGSVEAAGAGTAGTAPAYGPLLRACGMTQTITASTKVEYQPATSNPEALSAYFNLDGTLHKALGTRATFSLAIDAKGLPKLSFEMLGLYAPVTAAALPAATYTAFQAPEAVGYANTPAATINGVSVALQSLQYQHGNTVVLRELVGQRSVRITDRKPTMTLVIEAPDSLAQDYFALTRTRTPVPILLTHGSAAGRIVELQGARCEVAVTGYSNSDGMAMLNLTARPLPTLGDDEIVLRVR